MRAVCGHDTCRLRSIRHDVGMRPTMDSLHDDPVVRAARESGMSDEEKLEHRRESLKRMQKDVAALRRLRKSKHDLWRKLDLCNNAAKLNNVRVTGQYESLKRDCENASKQRNEVVAQLFHQSEALRDLTKKTLQEKSESVSACAVATKQIDADLAKAIASANASLNNELHLAYTQYESYDDADQREWSEWKDEELGNLSDNWDKDHGMKRRYERDGVVTKYKPAAISNNDTNLRMMSDYLAPAPETKMIGREVDFRISESKLPSGTVKTDPSRILMPTLKEKVKHLRKYGSNAFHLEPQGTGRPLDTLHWLNYKKMHAQVLRSMRQTTEQLLEDAKVHAIVFKELLQKEKSRWY